MKKMPCACFYLIYSAIQSYRSRGRFLKILLGRFSLSKLEVFCVKSPSATVSKSCKYFGDFILSKLHLPVSRLQIEERKSSHPRGLGDLITKKGGKKLAGIFGSWMQIFYFVVSIVLCLGSTRSIKNYQNFAFP